MMNALLTPGQKQQLTILETRLDKAISLIDYQSAKSVMLDIQAILKPAKHFARLVLSKNKLYELAVKLNDFDFAINGLLSNRGVLSDKTKIYLETTSLLAICYIRMLEIAKAKPYLKEVLTNEIVISSASERKIWRQRMIDRFKEEVIVSTMRSNSKPVYNDAEIEKEVVRIIQNNSEQEIYEEIGIATPKATREMLSILYNYSSKQPASAERLALPEPEHTVKNADVGVTVFESIKKVIYNSLCSRESDIYKAWFNNGMQVILSKGYIGAIVITCLIKFGIDIKLLAAPVIALITKFGIEVFCEKYKPVK